MQRLFAAVLAVLVLAGPARADDAVANAAAAAADLRAAISALDAAQGARDNVAALTTTIRAYEVGLLAFRDGLRQVALREAALTRRFQAQRDRIGRLLGVLASIDADAGPLLLLHPAGALGTARSGMILSEVTPALQAEAEELRGQLEELRVLRDLQTSAAGTLAEGLRAAQDARTALSQAISDRAPLPRRYIDDPEALNRLIDSAETLDAFALGLFVDEGAGAADTDFTAAQGTLALPVLGRVVRGFNEPDPTGLRRPGLLIATRPGALVSAPWAATIRYRGPLLDYGNVMILEPATGYLLVLAGLDTVYGEVGQVIPAGTPVGLMGGQQPDAAEFLVAAQEGGGVEASETLYMELRQGAQPVDPTGWFAETRK